MMKKIIIITSGRRSNKSYKKSGKKMSYKKFKYGRGKKKW